MNPSKDISTSFILIFTVCFLDICSIVNEGDLLL